MSARPHSPAESGLKQVFRVVFTSLRSSGGQYLLTLVEGPYRYIIGEINISFVVCISSLIMNEHSSVVYIRVLVSRPGQAIVQTPAQARCVANIPAVVFVMRKLSLSLSLSLSLLTLSLSGVRPHNISPRDLLLKIIEFVIRCGWHICSIFCSVNYYGTIDFIMHGNV